MAGSFQLTLTATEGPMSGRTVQGQLALRLMVDSLRRVNRPGATDTVTVPVIGTTDLAIEEVGAARLGNLLSADSERPGVAIWVSHGADGGVSAVMRIGQEQIHTNLLRIEGAYTALYVRQVSAAGIYGGWASGDGRRQVASGYFCATRL
jgi:hypothetical protein